MLTMVGKQDFQAMQIVSQTSIWPRRNAPQFSKTKNVLHWQLSGFVYLHTFFSLSNILCKLFPVRNFRKLLFISSKTCTNIGMCTMCQLPSNTIKKGLRPIATTGLFCLFCSVAHLHCLVKATWVQFLKLKQICCLFNPFQIILYQTTLSGPPNASCLFQCWILCGSIFGSFRPSFFSSSPCY